MANTTPTTNSLENYFLPFTANKDFKKEQKKLTELNSDGD